MTALAAEGWCKNYTIENSTLWDQINFVVQSVLYLGNRQ